MLCCEYPSCDCLFIYLFIYLALPNYLKQGDHCSFSQLQWISHINNNKARPPPPPPNSQATSQ